MVFATFFLCAWIAITVFAGDLIESKLSKGWLRAVVDNATHGIVAYITWTIFIWNSSNNVKAIILESLLCAFLASAIDADHFISAASFDLVEATNLKQRPFLHNTSTILLIGLIILFVSKWLALHTSWTLGWMLLAAGLSHHIRDANRRGFWLWPYGSTPPLPYAVYVALQVLFPILLLKTERLFDSPRRAGKSYSVPSIV